MVTVAMFDHGPHTVTIYPEVVDTDSRGNTVRKPADVGVVVSGCYVHPIASTRGAFPAIDVKQGQRVTAAWKLVCRPDAPLGWWSRVEWNGIRLNILGGPLKRGSSPTTAHISATLVEDR